MDIPHINALLFAYRDLFPDLSFVRAIKSGKEADVFLAASPQDGLFALKVYKDPGRRTFRKSDAYTMGKHVKNRSEARAMSGGNRAGKRIAHDKWIRREFYMLEKLYIAGCAIPKTYATRDHSILMEYIGDTGYPAPKLSDIALERSEAERTFEIIIENIRLFLKNGIVHGDLSEFNILYWHDRPYIIDFPQSIDIRNNPYAKEFLERDIRGVCKYFDRNSEEIIREYSLLLPDIIPQ